MKVWQPMVVGHAGQERGVVHGRVGEARERHSFERRLDLGPEAIHLTVEDLLAGGELVGAELLIIKDRRIVLHEAFGWSDREEQRPMERNSLFSITSMSKPSDPLLFRNEASTNRSTVVGESSPISMSTPSEPFPEAVV